MIYPPEIQSAIDAENARRARAWLPFTGGLLGFDAVPITPRIALELEIAGNAFVVGEWPRPEDVFALLWRLHPLFRRPDGSYPNRPGPADSGQAEGSAAERARLAMVVHTLSRGPLLGVIRDFIAEIYADAPLADDEDEKPSGMKSLLPPPQSHWFDVLVDHFASRYGWPVAVIIDMPMSQLQQLWRVAARSICPHRLRNRPREIAEEWMKRALAESSIPPGAN